MRTYENAASTHWVNKGKRKAGSPCAGSARRCSRSCRGRGRGRGRRHRRSSRRSGGRSGRRGDRALGSRRRGLGWTRGRTAPVPQEEHGEHDREADARDRCPKETHWGQGGRQREEHPRGVPRLGTPEEDIGGEGARREARQKHPLRQVHALLTPLLRALSLRSVVSRMSLGRPVPRLGRARVVGTLGQGGCKTATSE
jgi:hypothetical protein